MDSCLKKLATLTGNMADTYLGSFGSSDSKSYSEESECGRYELNHKVEVPFTVMTTPMRNPWCIGKGYGKMNGLRTFITNHPANHEFYCGAGVIKRFLLLPKVKESLWIDVTVDDETIPGRKLYGIRFVRGKKFYEKHQETVYGRIAAGHRFEQLMKKKIDLNDPSDTCKNVFQRQFQSGSILTWTSQEDICYKTVDGRRQSIEIKSNKESVDTFHRDEVLAQCFIGNIDFILAGTVGDYSDRGMEIRNLDIIHVAEFKLELNFNPAPGLKLLENFLSFVKQELSNVAGGTNTFILENKGGNDFDIKLR